MNYRNPSANGRPDAPLDGCVRDSKDRGTKVRSFAPELKFRVKFFLGLLIISYAVLRLIVYLTRVIAYYLMYGVWKFF